MIDYAPLRQPIAGIDPLSILTEELCNQFHRHAIDSYPYECIGAIVDGRYLKLDNVSDKPELQGKIAPETQLSLHTLGVQMLLHSHPNGPDCPSALDLRTQKDWGIPFGLCCTDGQGATAPIFWGDMLARPPLLGRGFIHGTQDCVGLILDYEEVINKRTLERPERDWEWWQHTEGDGLYEENFEKWGYRHVEGSLEPGDVIFLKAGARVVNHAAIYLGEHLILHHLAGRLEHDPSRLSTIEPLIRWQQHQRIAKVVRHWGRS